MAPANPPYRLALLVFALVVALGLWAHSSTRTDPSLVMSAQKHQDALAKVSLSIKQTATSPPTVALTVTNNYDAVLTLLDWNSPLDPAALALGVLQITPDGASAPLDLPTITFRRVMPPPPENLITLRPGESRTAEVVFQEPAVPVGELGAKAKVQAKGSWAAAWPGFTADQLTPETLDKLQFGDAAVTGPFESEVFELALS